jgi:hypothetical protein
MWRMFEISFTLLKSLLANQRVRWSLSLFKWEFAQTARLVRLVQSCSENIEVVATNLNETKIVAVQKWINRKTACHLLMNSTKLYLSWALKLTIVREAEASSEFDYQAARHVNNLYHTWILLASRIRDTTTTECKSVALWSVKGRNTTSCLDAPMSIVYIT